MKDFCCVRKGTEVLTPLNPPVNGGKWLSQSECYEQSSEQPVEQSSEQPGEQSWGQSDQSGKQGSPPFTGEPEGGINEPGKLEGVNASEGVISIPIEKITQGQMVYGHDGNIHSVVKVYSKNYTGRMIGIKLENLADTLWLTEDHKILVKKRRYSFTDKRNWDHVPDSGFKKARSLRKNLTPAEKQLWSKINNSQLSVKFRRQHPIGPYIVDFFCPERAIIIEIDGETHGSDKAVAYDMERTEFLTSPGLREIRFTNQDIYQNIDGVIQELSDEIGEQANFSPDAIWFKASKVIRGDIVYHGLNLSPTKIIEIKSEITSEAVYDLEVGGIHSFVTTVCITR